MIKNYLLKKYLKFDFADMSDMNRLKAYGKMKDPDIIKLFRARYTDSLVAMTMAKGDQLENLRGRILEDLNFLNSIENIDETLLNIDEHTKKQKQSRSILKELKNKLLKVGK